MRLDMVMVRNFEVILRQTLNDSVLYYVILHNAIS
jgi:hypothetical protein